MPKRRAAILLLSLLCTLAKAEDFIYTTNTGPAITITGYTGPGGDVAIPSAINGLPVTIIGDLAFRSCTNLISIAIPNSVTSIRTQAFRSCTSLASIAIPNSVTTIAEMAFAQCTSLTNVTIPNSVATIENSAFSLCTNLVTVAIPNSVTTIADWTFDRCTSLTTVIISDSVTTIGRMAFYLCTSLTNVTIGNSLTSIGRQAFFICTSLTSITIPNSVTNIGNSAFYNCTSLASITIPDSVTSIDRWAFGSCSNLMKVCFQGNAPSLEPDIFLDATDATICYLPGTTGWVPTFGGRPTAPWHLPQPTILTLPPNFGFQSNHFSFRVSWATNASVIVEASPSLSTPSWSPLATNTITMGVDQATDGWSDFTDPDWTNHPTRFYRVRSP